MISSVSEPVVRIRLWWLVPILLTLSDLQLTVET